MTSHQFHDRVAIVTGATSGIGITVAEELVRDGFSVVIVGRSRERGEAVVANLGARSRFIAADLTESEAPERVVKETLRHFSRLDVLVNNAAVDHTKNLLEVHGDEIRDTFESNVVSPIRLTIAAAAQMRLQGDGGSIINVTSRLASIGVPTMGIYSASKGAMHTFTKSAAIEFAPDNIRVNAVAPGLTRTPLYEEWIRELGDPEAESRRLSASIPLGRIAEPSDVAAAVRFLASPEASYITGASIPVEGGYLAQ